MNVKQFVPVDNEVSNVFLLFGKIRRQRFSAMIIALFGNKQNVIVGFRFLSIGNDIVEVLAHVGRIDHIANHR